MYMRDLCVRPGNMWDSLALSGSVAKDNRHPFVDFSIFPVDCFTLIGAV